MRKGDHLSNQLVIILMLDIIFELDSSTNLAMAKGEVESLASLALASAVRVAAWGWFYWTSCRRAGMSLAVTGEGLRAVSRQTT